MKWRLVLDCGKTIVPGTRDFFLSLSTWAGGRALGHLCLQYPL